MTIKLKLLTLTATVLTFAGLCSASPASKQHLSRRLAGTGPDFGTAQSYAAGFSGPTQTVVADFNGDGALDVAAVNPCVNYCAPPNGYGSVAVMLGNGDGTFQAPVIYAIGTYKPLSLAAGDFNGDGHTDLVVASDCASNTTCGTGAVSLLLGNGDGTFQPTVTYPAGSGSSYFVAAGDLNNDGALDLVVVNQTSTNSMVSVMLGNGDGTFHAPVCHSTAAGYSVYAVLADLNLDGALDVVVVNGNTSDSVSVLLGNGDGTLQTAVLYASGGALASGVAVGDFDGNGVPDLAVVNNCINYSGLMCPTSGSVGVLLGNGDGTFQPTVAYPSGGNVGNSVAVTDVDGDGLVDLVVANVTASGGGTAGVLSTLSGNGDGTFQPAITYGTGGAYASAVVLGDFNGDGQPDVAVTDACAVGGNCGNGLMGVLLNTVTGFSQYASATTLTSSANPAIPGGPVTLTAMVTSGFNPGAATGNVTFYDGPTALFTAGLTNGQAALSTAFNTTGPHALRAIYSGDTSYAGSASTVVSEAIGTPVQLSSSANPVAYLLPTTFTATVTGTGATGTVTFMDGANRLRAIPVTNGTAAMSTSSLTAGTHHITATYSGDSNFQAGGAALTQAVSQPTTTALTASVNPVTVNQAVTFTATVTGQYGGTPSGAVAFFQGSASLGTAPLVNGQASLTTAFMRLDIGTVAMTAVYLGDPNDQTSNAPVLNETVVQAQIQTSITLQSSGSPSFVGQAVTFTAVVLPASGTILDGEVVTFNNGGTVIGSGTTAGGVALFTTSSLAVGNNAITAVYVGDANFQTSTSKVVMQAVNLYPTSTAFTASVNPSAYGQSVTLTATVTAASGPGLPTGNVTFKNGTTAIGSATLVNGVATLPTSNLTTGTQALSASYKGDSNFAAGSGTLSQVVNQAATTTTLTSSPNPSAVNQTVTFTAMVAGAFGGTVTGSVTFTQGAQTLGTVAVAGNGKAILTNTFSTTGTYGITAAYTGDTNNLASTSAVLSQSVNTGTTTTALTSSGTPTYAGAPVTFIATVTSTFGAIPDGEIVTFYLGVTPMGAGLTAGGVATYTTSTLTVGSHSFTATYSGDAIFQTSTSRPFKQVVNINTTSTGLVSSVNPSAWGQAVTLTATVTSGTGPGTPTGQVTFKNGTISLGPVVLVNGTASLTNAKLPAGSQALSASYTGDTNFAASSATLTQTVNPATTTTALTSNHNPASLNQSITFTANVTGQYGATTGGSVTFMQGNKTLGTSALTNGKATLATSYATAGTYSITAVYSGDTNDSGSTSAVLSQAVGSGNTTTTLTSNGTPSYVGQPVTFTATVTSTQGSIPDGDTVTFYDGANAIGTGTTTGGNTTFTTSSLATGTHQMTATYAGDGSFVTSTSHKYVQVVSVYVTTTVVTSNVNPAVYGQSITFTATVTSAGPVPTGTMTFKSGSTALGTATMSGGVATLTKTVMDAGTYQITAAYGGDGFSAKSTSAVYNQTVNLATTTTTVSSSANPSKLGHSVTLIATVTSPTGNPTGSVTFTMGATNLGTASLAGGSAKLPITTLPTGADTITATYIGTFDFAVSSGTIIQTVN